MIKTVLIVTTTTLVLSGCVSSNTDQQPTLKIANFQVAPTDIECTIFESRDWQARLMPSATEDNQYTLAVKGEVDLPSPAYQVKWYVGPTDRAYPPNQRLQLATENASEGASIQVITSTSVNYQLETKLSAFKNVLISCGDEVIATIPVTYLDR